MSKPKLERKPPRLGHLIAVLGVLVLIGVLVGTPIGCQLLEKLFGPPARELSEEYENQEGKATVDHSLLDKVVKAHVKEGSYVDYESLLRGHGDLDAYLEVLATTDFKALGRDQKMVLLINAYNAFTLALILDHWPLESINDIPKAERWAAKRWQIGELTLSLEEIENDYLRARFKEPRIHFAINCASVGCPPLRQEAYVVERLEQQLQDQTQYVHSHDRWFVLDTAKGTLQLTQLYSWYGGDFEQVAGSVLAFAARHSRELKLLMDRGQEPRIEWMEYDWSLNMAR